MATKMLVDKVWEKAKHVRGEDPSKYRQDPYGNKIHRNSFGRDSEMGWEIDHIKPSSRGGSDNIRNLQALKTKVNREKADNLVKRSRHSKK
ncbi:MAG: HNH endonuclease [Candidatus Thiodiazotropha taylori]|nr:HNH endonuclease [Candidatus Thiodiazotropha taylori]MCW4226928.1 HNH endonuclease [Candidatus Thiodiazotropha endolucinida]MCG7888488.1 HNH endonuclease [Candidatus Thiodiazotropha taylori]MCG7890072.1 HNH endonuclease [Candidatus Thiodiazotropha taylori]MCG7950395.1 HNH endonuclease [Candidatus Thiodiazotropha taylori]